MTKRFEACEVWCQFLHVLGIIISRQTLMGTTKTYQPVLYALIKAFSRSLGIVDQFVSVVRNMSVFGCLRY